jgi:hypothetical protein
MDWLTEHLDMVLPIALVLLFLFQRMFTREEGEGAPPTAETDEDARRIQEEIRRKIIARQRGEDVAEPPAFPGEQRQEPPPRPATFPRRQEGPPPVRRQTPSSFPGAQRRTEPPPVRQPQESSFQVRDLQGELQAQRERLRQSQQAKEEAMQRTGSAQPLRRSDRVPTRQMHSVLVNQVREDLSTAENLKRAFLLKEIVDRPVGLRDRADVFSNWG